MNNIEKINPIKREEIISILNNKEITKYFFSIKIFGSSIREDCSNNSDIDLFVTLKSEYENDKGVNDSYLALMRGSSSEKDIFYAHEQRGKFNHKFYSNMRNGIEILK